MTDIWIGISPGPLTTRILGMAGASETILKARLSPEPSHPRALATLLEAVALWQGTPVRAALAAACPAASNGIRTPTGAEGRRRDPARSPRTLAGQRSARQIRSGSGAGMGHSRVIRRRAVWGAVVTMNSATLGCIGGQQTAVALYDGSPAPRDQVARLSGYVRYVDGVDVSERGTLFELLPGCHLVGTPQTWSRGDALSGSVAMNTGRIVFALVMRRAHHYEIEVGVVRGSGPTGRGWVKAVERDSSGTTTGTFGPAQDEEDVRRCLAFTPPSN
jgi:hypothetical protein